MKIDEIITERYKQVWGRTKSGIVKRYRCLDGRKKGRVVAKPSTCSTNVNPKKSISFTKTRRLVGKKQAAKRSIRMDRPTSKRLVGLNRKSNIRPHKRKH